MFNSLRFSFYPSRGCSWTKWIDFYSFASPLPQKKTQNRAGSHLGWFLLCRRKLIAGSEKNRKIHFFCVFGAESSRDKSQIHKHFKYAWICERDGKIDRFWSSFHISIVRHKSLWLEGKIHHKESKEHDVNMYRCLCEHPNVSRGKWYVNKTCCAWDEVLKDLIMNSGFERWKHQKTSSVCGENVWIALELHDKCETFESSESWLLSNKKFWSCHATKNFAVFWGLTVKTAWAGHNLIEVLNL